MRDSESIHDFLLLLVFAEGRKYSGSPPAMSFDTGVHLMDLGVEYTPQKPKKSKSRQVRKPVVKLRRNGWFLALLAAREA